MNNVSISIDISNGVYLFGINSIRVRIRVGIRASLWRFRLLAETSFCWRNVSFVNAFINQQSGIQRNQPREILNSAAAMAPHE
jgi:hypothetical protein